MKFTHLITFAILMSIVLLSFSCGGTSTISAKEGDPAPSFSASTISGETKSLSNFSGKPLMIVFEGRPCPNCDKQRPFVAAAAKAAGKTVNVITIFRPTINKPTPEYIKPHVESEKIAEYSTVILDQNDAIAPTYGLGNATPCTILIDSQGIIRKKQIVPFTSQQEVEALLKSVN
jgi:peroxiredoxin